MLPSEFKSNWESLVKDQIMEAFDNCFSDYALLTYLVQDTINIIYNESLEIIKEKILNILKALNIFEQNINISNNTNKNTNNNTNNNCELSLKLKNKETKENKLSNNNSNNKPKKGENNNTDNSTELLENYEKFLCKFRLIFQEYFSIIFHSNTSEFQTKIKEKLNQIVNEDEIYKNFSEEKKNFIAEDLNSKSFGDFAESAMKLCLYMHLHEPKLTFNFPSCKNSKAKMRKLLFYYYKKDEFTNIEGFPKEKCCCVVIMPCPVLRSNYSYQGIKPAVYIVGSPTQEVIDECEKAINKDKEKTEVYALEIVSSTNYIYDKKKNENELSDDDTKKKEFEKGIAVSLNNKEDNEADYDEKDIKGAKKDEDSKKNETAIFAINKHDKLVEEKKENLQMKDGKSNNKICL